jgi:hypothetical protein
VVDPVTAAELAQRFRKGYWVRADTPGWFDLIVDGEAHFTFFGGETLKDFNPSRSTLVTLLGDRSTSHKLLAAALTAPVLSVDPRKLPPDQEIRVEG